MPRKSCTMWNLIKDDIVSDLMQQLDDYNPTIPDSVTAHYLARAGTRCFVVTCCVHCTVCTVQYIDTVF